ncbi:unnamed protein product [Protopolystoma xenopodis]|uniref:Uncharacterized protein n=1 Tax=Protopolystoma xenopodis TaxID=117903 RepID=A0A3S5B0T6_9PLAT|nr:unnamed protein product [Protopolystoma xenopodis]
MPFKSDDAKPSRKFGTASFVGLQLGQSGGSEREDVWRRKWKKHTHSRHVVMSWQPVEPDPFHQGLQSHAVATATQIRLITTSPAKEPEFESRF